MKSFFFLLRSSPSSHSDIPPVISLQNIHSFSGSDVDSQPPLNLDEIPETPSTSESLKENLQEIESEENIEEYLQDAP